MSVAGVIVRGGEAREGEVEMKRRRESRCAIIIFLILIKKILMEFTNYAKYGEIDL